MVKTYSYAKDKDVFFSFYFKVGEFRSFNDKTGKLTTDKILIDENLPVMLENLYSLLDNKYGLKSIVINSGYRSDDFEESLSGGVRGGTHTQGKGADIVCYNKKGSVINNKEVCCLAEDIGFKGIGYGGTYSHVDVRDTKSFFDETNGKTGISSFYSYFNIAKVDDNSDTLNYKIGDIVSINGVYVSSDATEKLVPKIKKGKITKIKLGSKNPYLLDDGAIGWVNDSVIVSNIYLANLSYDGDSIVDALSLIGVDSSYNNRSKLAKANGITNYSGTAEQNLKLLNLLKKGELISI